MSGSGGRLVVVGLPELGSLLGQGFCETAFAEVVNLAGDDGPGGRVAVADAMAGQDPEDLAFVFCDIVAPGLRSLAGGLARGDHRVILLTGNGSPPLDDLTTLHIPFSPNDVLDALSQLPGVGFLPPAEGLDDLFQTEMAEPEPEGGQQDPPEGWGADEHEEDGPWARPSPVPAAAAAQPPAWEDWEERDDPAHPVDDDLVDLVDDDPAWPRPDGLGAGGADGRLLVETGPGDRVDPGWRPGAPAPARPLPTAATMVDFDRRAPDRPAPAAARGPRRPSRARTAPAGRGCTGRVVAFTCPKGGTGKSSTSLALAAYLGDTLRKANRSVVFVDANVQQADAARYLRRAHGATIADLVHADPAAIDEKTLSRLLVHDDDNHMSILFGPPTLAEADPRVVTPALYARVVTVLRSMFDWIVVDTPVAEKHHQLFSEFVLSEADRLVVVINPNHVTIENASRWLTAIADPVYAGGDAYERAAVRVLLNKSEEGIGADTTDVAALLDDYTFVGAIPESPAWRSAANNGELLAGDSRLAPVFAEILYGITAEPALLSRKEAKAAARAGGASNEPGSNGHAGTGWFGAWVARQREKAAEEDTGRGARRAGRRRSG